MSWRIFFIGIFFSGLWGSASTATKLGLQVAQPFVIATTMFIIAGSMMVLFGFIISNLVLQEPISFYTLAGKILVFAGLFIILRFKKTGDNPTAFFVSE
jgi:probable blue pigment (indigoidine) exporter